MWTHVVCFKGNGKILKKLHSLFFLCLILLLCIEAKVTHIASQQSRALAYSYMVAVTAETRLTRLKIKMICAVWELWLFCCLVLVQVMAQIKSEHQLSIKITTEIKNVHISFTRFFLFVAVVLLNTVIGLHWIYWILFSFAWWFIRLTGKWSGNLGWRCWKSSMHAGMR